MMFADQGNAPATTWMDDVMQAIAAKDGSESKYGARPIHAREACAYLHI